MASLPAQSSQDVQRELARREAKATTTDELLEVARWAREHRLDKDAERLLTRILELDPDHEGAHRERGEVRYGDEWVPAAVAAERTQRDRDAEFHDRGWTKVDGVWVPPKEVADARKGVFYHDGVRISRGEALQWQRGQVPHPVTGAFIPASDLARAESGLFPLPDGRWVDAATADSFHSELATPWLLRTHFATLLTTLPSARFDELKSLVDGSVDLLRPLIGDDLPDPAHRPVVFVCATTDQYRELGVQIGSERSVYGAFLADREPQLDHVEIDRPPAVANGGGPQGWGPYYVRHATGLAVAAALADQHGSQLPYWLVCGIGAFAERHYTEGVSAFFGKQHLQRGGVGDLEKWFADFEIGPDIATIRIEHNIYQAGLLLAYALRCDTEPAHQTLAAIRAAFGDGKDHGRAAQRLEKMLTEQQDAIQDYLKKLASGG